MGFADFWLADQLNSLSTVLLDFEYMICFYGFEVKWLPDPDSMWSLFMYQKWKVFKSSFKKYGGYFIAYLIDLKVLD